MLETLMLLFGAKIIYQSPARIILPTLTFEEKIEIKSEEYNVDIKKVLAIIDCESGRKPNAVNINKNGSKDFSYWQINDRTHMNRAKELGFDIMKPEDNLEYGFILLSTGGDIYWKYSKLCWDKANKV